ncbi:MAG: hypothetical protein ACOYU0_04120 [Nitrospirota bacterium]
MERTLSIDNLHRKFILVFIIVFSITCTVDVAFTASLVPEIPYTLYVNPSVAASLASYAGAYMLFKHLDYYGTQVEESRRMVSVDLMTGQVDFDQTSVTVDVLPNPSLQESPFPLLSEYPWPSNICPEAWNYFECFPECSDDQPCGPAYENAKAPVEAWAKAHGSSGATTVRETWRSIFRLWYTSSSWNRTAYDGLSVC